jgi:hypothetical protein
MAMHAKKPSSGGSGIAKETIIGLLAILWGGYNLLVELNVISPYFDTSGIQIVGNIILIIAGFLLLITAYKLWRYRFHTRGLF